MKSCFPFIVFCLSPFCLAAQADKNASGKDRMFFAGVYTKNIDSAIHWYSKVFQLKQLSRTDNEQRGFKQVNLINDNLWFELVELKQGINAADVLKGSFEKSTLNGLGKIGFRTPDIETRFSELKTLGVKFLGKGIFTDSRGKKGFVIADPDGNMIQYFED